LAESARPSPQPRFSTSGLFFEQLESAEVFCVQSDVLNAVVQRLCYTLEGSVVKREYEVQQRVEHLGIVAGMDGVHSLQSPDK
jgi:hypothetical protein